MAWVLLASCLAGCAGPRPVCAPGTGPPVQVFNLFFGKSIPGRSDLTEAEWQSFLDKTATAYLPNGYTVLDAGGAWMNPITGRTIRQGTKLLLVALPVGAEGIAAVNRVRLEYQDRFRQQLVGMTVVPGCGAL